MKALRKNTRESFLKLSRRFKEVRLLKSLPGIGDVHAVRILASVVNARRFKSKGHFLSYCGLIKHEKISGGRSYGKRASRYYRPLRQVFKMASHTVIREGYSNAMRDLYEHLIIERGKPPEVARCAVARRLAVLAYGVLKTGEKFDPNRREKKGRQTEK